MSASQFTAIDPSNIMKKSPEIKVFENQVSVASDLGVLEVASISIPLINFSDIPESVPLPPSPLQFQDNLPPMYASNNQIAPKTSVHAVEIHDERGKAGANDNKRATDDILGSIGQLYRILELITEQGSGGLVDKIIIAQDSLSEFINTISPNAYTSLTKVDFKRLDSVTALPIGVYGPQEMLVSFLITLGILDESKAQRLLSLDDKPSRRRLQSGIYIALPPGQEPDATKIFIIFWPEKTTWDDDAVSSVRRNRVTFMRYLSKISDQILCLLPDTETKTIIWNACDDTDTEDIDFEDENIDRLFSFEVSKTLEQDEDVTIRIGFDIPLSVDATKSSSNDDPQIQPAPRLLTGEINQGFLTTDYIKPSRMSHPFRDKAFTEVQLREILKTPAIKVEPTLKDEGLEILVKGLKSRFPELCNRWTVLKSDIDQQLEELKSLTIEESMKELDNDPTKLKTTLLAEYLRRIKIIYPRCDFTSLSNKYLKTELTSEEKFPQPPDENLPQDNPSASSVSSVSSSGAGGGLPSEDNPSSTARSDDRLIEKSDEPDLFHCLVALYPQIGKDFDSSFSALFRNKKILSSQYRMLKEQLVTVQVYLEDHPDLDMEGRRQLTKQVFSHTDDSSKGLPSDPETSGGGFLAGLAGIFTSIHSKTIGSYVKSPLQKVVSTRLGQLGDAEFLKFDDVSRYGDSLPADAVSKTLMSAACELQAIIEKALDLAVARARDIQRRDCQTQVDHFVLRERQIRYADLRSKVIQEIEDITSAGENDKEILYLNALSVNHDWHKQARDFKITARVESLSDPLLEYSIHSLELTSDDRHNLQLDQKHIPTPKVNGRFSHSFRLPMDHSILHSQLLPNGKILLIVDDEKEMLLIYLESLSNIGNALQAKRARKTVYHEKLGRAISIAFDESKRMLALFAPTKFLLHVFSFDENFGVLQSWAQPINLSRWYSPTQIIGHLCFVTGNEELLLVDHCGQARIFSLVTQQCRPATLELRHRPSAVLPSPDGACFLAVFDHDMGRAIRAYHWTTFGSNDGISMDIEIQLGQHLGLTSFVNKAVVHLMIIDENFTQCNSVILDITKKTTEFMFHEKATGKAHSSTQRTSIHNCLLDCHSEVWTRFPVVPAVQRLSKTSATVRCRKTLTFVTNNDHHLFAPYFANLINTFELKTRKPTGSELRSIIVSAISSSDLQGEYLQELDTSVISQYRTGEWIVGLLCLIPIHIAITRENRFIPLKDGITSAEYEKSLLGAEISSVVDSISFGWYESILQSYMATKPVKVVSSMGEQSVGKSYALNHLADTSFAGSAMRTTEGVWMSITPTDDVLVVALDFEGVHSIERSAQEDTLLVLFNTAISNLVLFRNNFALSRDITGLFQSFQSSSSVFDPAANPTLFRSTLVIIIKDVVDSDKKEIVREFSLKFQKIVQEEQESNFISRLHAGQLNIIPWPVIESKQFYTLFPAIKSCLDKQPVTHQSAGHFLHTLKTLMAKLKANDWRALSQSMAAHRAHQLLSILPNALAFGRAEPGPYPEPLKDLDTDDTIDFADSSSEFFLSVLESQSGIRDRRLNVLCQSWTNYHTRNESKENEWLNGLSTYLGQLVELRIEYVKLWLHKNLDKFQNATSQASVTALYRLFDATLIDLRANVELCRRQCTSCQLLCLLSCRHEDKVHDCLTSHSCLRQCDFAEEHPDDSRICGYPAGHYGRHVCVVDAHLCGEPCILQDNLGCLGECTQVVGHKDDEHRCSANIHFCGKPCQLTTQFSKAKKSYSCSSTCAISSDVEHDFHICDNRMCPMKCQLCSRLCASDNHLHALDEDVVHLCGEIHPCQALCTAKGICEIDTTPQSIEATFTGRHQTFQYTKYSQVAKRLSCVISIPPMRLEHGGQHCHTIDPKPFHFCETRCEQCGYYCTLPLGHSQQEHETSHGSMSRSRWAIENPNAVMELNGRKFGSDDEGAPMMCNLVCQDMGRHVHIDYCRADSEANCNAQDTQHIRTRMNPNPAQPKDWITHELFWKRLGFKDPYSRDDKTNFAKCDAMCAGPEHTSTASNPTQPSYCTLPMFHAPHAITSQGIGLGYVSNDGHLFSCKNPAVMQQAFHVIFVIDRSGSMVASDRRPLPGTPVTDRISRASNNRLGAVYSSLYAFWASRLSAVGAGQNSQTPAQRRDSYSVILFDHNTVKCVNNDFTQSPEQLIDALLPYRANGGTDYNAALTCAQEVMRQHWNTERSPVVIFLSDGECSVGDGAMQTFCRSAIALGKPLSFHGVAFGPQNGTLRRMVQIAREIQASVPRDPLLPATSIVESSFAEALDSVRLAQTFLGIAESLKKPRGSLFQG